MNNIEKYTDSVKEIKSLGWEHLGAFYWYWPYNTYWDEFSSRQLSWRLNVTGKDSWIRVEVYERNSFEWEPALLIPYDIILLLNWMDSVGIIPNDANTLIEKTDEVFKK